MSVTVKSAKEIELMREAGRLLEIVHDELGQFVRPGISTLDIDREGERLIRKLGCVPNFLHYNGYPASICVSVNDEVVHGIPRKNHILQEGDIVSLDAGLIYKGFHSDAARTHGVGKISPEAQKLIDVTRESFFKGIEFAPERAFLKALNLPDQESISTRFRRPLVLMQSPLDMAWFGIWLAMVLVRRFMKTLRFLILLRSVEASG